MPDARFLQIHWLASYPGTLLNRDDSGLAKRLMFGGAARLRVSSQAFKRRLRMAEDEASLRTIDSAPIAARSKHVIAGQVLKGLAGETDRSEEMVAILVPLFEKALYGEKGDKEDSRQALLIGYPEIAFLREKARQLLADHADAAGLKSAAEAFAKEFKPVWKQMRQQTAMPGGIEAALFGRMVTSDPEANIDAAVHVAHALSVHPAETEIDYVTAVDDLDSEGAAGIFDAELTSGLYYGYLVVDVPLLVSNTTGAAVADWKETDRALAAEVVNRLVRLVATVSPGAKKGSTAPYAYADTMLVEIGARQPRTLANAFLKPVRLKDDVGAAARKRLIKHLVRIDENYGSHEVRRIMSLGELMDGAPERATLGELAAFAASSVGAAEV